MKKSIITILLLAFPLFAQEFIDSDLDGVEDSRDKCPDTPFLELVDSDGCPLKRSKFYLRLGLSFSEEQLDQRYSTSYSLAYAYGNFYVSATGRYYLKTADGTGLGDSSLYGSYTFSFDGFYIIPGIRFRLPTGDRKFTDGYVDTTFSGIFDYYVGDFDFFFYGSYTIRSNPLLNNTHTLSAGPGYYLTDSVYANLTYDLVKSSVREIYYQYLSAFFLFDLTDIFYATLSYSYGLTPDSTDHTASFRIGMRF